MLIREWSPMVVPVPRTKPSAIAASLSLRRLANSRAKVTAEAPLLRLTEVRWNRCNKTKREM